mmetsp:Transcript_35548/g.57126  ORF Transcript_35548/g.57126 Transcript_35548/m.57126 type:complete len:346 (-) Transcript_35548:171-1208(-)
MLARSHHPIAAALLVAALLLATGPAGTDARGKKNKEVVRAVKSDLKYIKCQVCQEVAKNLNREASALRDAKGATLTEADVQGKVEKVCDVETVEGEWLIKHDLVEEGDVLKMQHMGSAFGECGTECKTMQRACHDIIGDRDTDIAEAIFTDTSMKRAALTSLLCNSNDGGGACLKKAPPLPKDRAPGPAFVEKTEKEIEMQRMMKTMKDAGMGNMNMYSKDDMADLAADYEEENDMGGDMPGLGGDVGDGTGGYEDTEGTEGMEGADVPFEPEASYTPTMTDKLKEAGAGAYNWAKGLFGGVDSGEKKAPEKQAGTGSTGGDPKKKKKGKKSKSKTKKSAKAAEL